MAGTHTSRASDTEQPFPGSGAFIPLSEKTMLSLLSSHDLSGLYAFRNSLILKF